MRPQGISDLANHADERVLALSFLETKQYDHPVWSHFITSLEHHLLVTDDNALDAEWLRQVHLFMVVCADAERASKLLRRVENADRLKGFFEVLRGRTDGTIYRLINSYAEQDAAAAFRVSALCQIDMLDQLPDVIIKNCDQPPFFTLLLDLASREPRRLFQWSCALSEAGLRSPAVANLFVASSVTLWAAQAELVDRRHRWFGRLMVNRTPYTECVSVACSANETTESFPLVYGYAIRGPGNDWSILSMVCLNILFITAFGIFTFKLFSKPSFSFTPNFFGGEDGRLSTFYFMIVTLVLEVLAISSAIIATGRREVYRNILSLPNTKAETSSFIISKFTPFLTRITRLYPLFMGRHRMSQILQYTHTRRVLVSRGRPPT
jgi:hypothetical protein